jgi:TonB family protein
VDFGPYLQRILQDVKDNWYNLIPESAEMKKGKLAIEFAITKDGKVADMRLIATSGDVALDRAAWGGINASNPFPPLPAEFSGPYLALRFRFYYNPDKADLQ